MSSMLELVYSPPVWETIIVAAFLLTTLTLSLYLLFEHLSAYKNPEEQKFLIGVILMVPCYSIESGAAVAYVADLLKVPAIFVKAVTDIIDGEKPTAEEFLQNLASVTTALDLAVEQISNLTSSLKKNWPTLACPSGNGIQFWTHEWEKHRTCSESILKQHDYFETTLNLKQKSNLLDALTSAGIQADGGSYSLSSIKDVIEKEVGFTPFIDYNVYSSRNSQLYQVYLCVDSSGSNFIECPVFPHGKCGSDVEFPSF